MIKKLLFALCVMAAGNAYSQCTPNPAYANEDFGVWPDTISNFKNGTVGVFYSDTMNLMIPADAGAINPSFAGFTIDSVAFNQLTNLPPGIHVICNSQTGAACTYIANTLGCGLVEGTPTTAGTYEMVMEVTVYLALFGNTQAIPYSFEGYRIHVAEESGTGITELAPSRLEDVKTVPNPFSERTEIKFNLSAASMAQVEVFNLLGEKLWSRTVQGKAGANAVGFRANELESGIYIYHVKVDGVTRTGRMMVNR